MTPFHFGRMQIISHAACLNNQGESEQGGDVNFSTFPTHMGFFDMQNKDLGCIHVYAHMCTVYVGLKCFVHMETAGL